MRKEGETSRAIEVSVFGLATLLGFEGASLQINHLEETGHDDVAAFVVLRIKWIGLFEEELGLEFDWTVEMIGFERELWQIIKETINVFKGERGRSFTVDGKREAFENLEG